MRCAPASEAASSTRRAAASVRFHLPIGFVYDAVGRVVLDPESQVQESVRLLFQTFSRTGAAAATVKHFRKEGLLFPTPDDFRPTQRGARRGVEGVSLRTIAGRESGDAYGTAAT
jgi:hypothetical protein